MRKFTQQLVQVDSVSWTSVTVPIFCSSILIENNETGTNDLYRRIDSADADTQKTIPAGFQEAFQLRKEYMTPGEIAFYLKSVSGTFNVLVEFLL